MALEEITLKNFKAFKREQRLEIKPITLIYGANSSGKSSILDSILFAHVICNEGLFDYKGSLESLHFAETIVGEQIIKLGGLSNLVHKGERTLEISWKFDGCADSIGANGEGPWRISFLATGPFGFHASPVFVFDVFYGEGSNPIIRYDENLYNDRDHGFAKLKIYADEFCDSAIWECAIENYLKEVRKLRKKISKMHTSVPTIRKFLKSKEFKDFLFNCIESNRVSFADFPYRVELNGVDKMDTFIRPFSAAWENIIAYTFYEFFKGSLNGFIFPFKTFRSHFHSLFYCSSVREIPDLRNPVAMDRFVNIETSRNKGWELDYESLKLVNGWLTSLGRKDANYELRVKARVPNSYDEKNEITEQCEELELWDLNRDLKVSFDSVGTGIGQMLPVALAVYSDREGNLDDHLCVIKQPELHLHPALQSEIGDLFVKGIRSLPGKQIIAETHSEHLLLRIMRRIRETHEGKEDLPEELRITNDDVAVYYVENLGKESVVYPMPLSEKGELLRDWPGGFFEEGLREVLY